MNALPYQIGQALNGGFFAGAINIDGITHGLIVAPKSSELKSAWHEDDVMDVMDVISATSYYNGIANTKAMAESGSGLAKQILALQIGGHADWYLPSQDELEIVYRNLKPKTEKNFLYARSGINPCAVPPTRPYTITEPAQTAAEVFKEDGAEAFDGAWYWTSTQHAAYPDFAWCQGFNGGGQDLNRKNVTLRARAVRRFVI